MASSGGPPDRADGGGSDATSAADAAPPPPPTPDGCIDDVSPGDHVYTCSGLTVNVAVPDACMRPGCGLIVELHGDTGTGPLMDANTNLFALGKKNGYLVVAPTGRPGPGGPGATWAVDDDEKVVAITDQVAKVWRADPSRIHLTGFSRGGFVTWRLLCKHADLYASFAPATAGSAPGGGCNGVAETSCPFDATGTPSRQADVLFLIGRTDVPVPYACTSRIRDQAIGAWSMGAPVSVDGDASYSHRRWTSASGVVLETFEHAYETDPTGPWGSARGHCFPGSTIDPFGPEYALPCKPPNAFTWGEEVMKFFQAHPKR
jgi:poly(3-hydroxybutyrate) depolymerase